MKKIAEITYGSTIYTLVYALADPADQMHGAFLSLYQRGVGEQTTENEGFGASCIYKNCIYESNYGKTPEEAVAEAVTRINDWLKANAGEIVVPEMTEAEKWAAAVVALIEKLTFFLGTDGKPQVK